MQFADIRKPVDQLSQQEFDALLKRYLDHTYGASLGADGQRRIWHDEGSRRRFVHGGTWSEALWRAWQRWQWDPWTKSVNHAKARAEAVSA